MRPNSERDRFRYRLKSDTSESVSGIRRDANSNASDTMSRGNSHALKRFEPVLLVGVGGFVGAVLRHVVSGALPVGFPWGTLTVNVAGSFALGVLLYEAHLTDLLAPETRLVVGTGFLSSFTTYSTFAVQTASLSPMVAVANVGANYVLGILAVLLGRRVVGGVVS